MIRKFLPVGQGAFYCEQFGREDNEDRVNIVYDCGTLSGQNCLETCIRDIFKQGETIHAVFLSHLHEDHINGLPFLMKYCRVEKIFFPLITESNVPYMSLYNTIKTNNQNAFSVKFIRNPYEAFDTLGLEYTPQLYGVTSDTEDGLRIDARPVASGRDVSGHIFDSGMRKMNLCNDWLYVPYNFKQDDRLRNLQRQFQIIMGQQLTGDRLQALWEDNIGSARKDIKEAYRRVKGDFNTNSMTLYSGIKCDIKAQVLFCKNHIRCCCTNQYVAKKIGCLYTGDYDAKEQEHWEALYNAYNTYWGSIGCVQLPHHGSRYNYNEGFMALDAFFIMSAGLNHRHNHPHSNVIKNLLYYGRFPHIVTEQRTSEITLEVFK